MRIFAERALLPEGMAHNQVIHIEAGVVRAVYPGEDGDTRCALAVPGLIDTHTHGGFGTDVMHACPEGLLAWLDSLLARGVTRVLAGVYTSPVPVMRAALSAARAVMDKQAHGAPGARLMGVHLEGPFISMSALGAMRGECVLEPTLERYREVAGGYEDIIRLVTLAPEVPGALELTRHLRAAGVAVQAGHTMATAEQGARAFECGVTGVAHFFNASTPIRHRAPGILTEALLDPSIYAECICDLVHVHPSAIRLIHRCKGAARMIVVSDSVSTTGLPDGVYPDNGVNVVVRQGVSRTEAGALNGGGCPPLAAVRNLIAIGVPEADAFRMASETPARFLRVRAGQIVPGEQAEVLCLDHENRPVKTMLGEQAKEGTP